MALLAPIPSARERMAMIVKVGAFSSMRSAYLRSVSITKLQAPSSREIPNTNRQRGSNSLRLKLGASLEFGASYDEPVAQLDNAVSVSRIYVRVGYLNVRGPA